MLDSGSLLALKKCIYRMKSSVAFPNAWPQQRELRGVCSNYFDLLWICWRLASDSWCISHHVGQWHWGSSHALKDQAVPALPEQCQTLGWMTNNIPPRFSMLESLGLISRFGKDLVVTTSQSLSAIQSAHANHCCSLVGQSATANNSDGMRLTIRFPNLLTTHRAIYLKKQMLRHPVCQAPCLQCWP